MSTLNNPIPSNGQPLLHQKSSATQDACQHPSMAQSVQGARTLKQFRSDSSKKSSLSIACRDPLHGESISTISDAVGPKKEEFQFAPVAQSRLCLLSDNEKFVRIDGSMGDLDHRRISSKPSIVLAVSVSSAVKLEAGQVELIARKMQKLTGFRNLRLENTVDPSLIAGFTISYGDDESNVIDGSMGDLDHRRISSKPSIVLAVSVSSAVKLEAGQVELIARKMQKLTGFRNLRLENTVDPSLIAGFTISYGDDESNVIDLSVKGQLAALAARVESSERRTANNEQSWRSP